jgi:RimJ/RimL family protein N-acetyltransferase
VERAEELYAKVANETDSLWLVIVERETGGYVGEVVLNELNVDNRSCNFRIALVGPRAFGRGYGTEASRLMLAHAFAATGVNRIGLEVHAFNPRARRAYEKVGFVYEGTKREDLLWEGERVDTEIMAVLAEDWKRHGGHP